MRTWLRRHLPTSDQIRNHRWLGWLGPWLHHHRLWHWSRRGVALGVALGVFFGLLIPVAQIPLAAGAAVMLRANLPVAVASTLVTNPLTFPPIYFAAWRLGTWVTGEAAPAPSMVISGAHAAPAGAPAPSEKTFLQQLAALGRPLIVGLALVATVTSLGMYWLVYLVWHGAVLYRRRRGRLRPRANP